MLEVIIYGSFIVLQERVGVAQTVASLSLHSFILQKPGQLQRLPERKRQNREGEGQSDEKFYWSFSGKKLVIRIRQDDCVLVYCSIKIW